MNKLNPGSVASGLETEWDYSGRKERDGQKKKIVKDIQHDGTSKMRARHAG